MLQALVGGDGGAGVFFGSGFFEVVVVAAGVAGDLAAVDVEHLGGEGADEVDVVRDEDEGALEALEGADEAFDAPDVKVGGGLVHEEEVGRVHEELDEVEAALLTAGEDFALFVDVLTAEEKGAEDGAGVVLTELGGAAADFFEDAEFGVQGVAAVLGEVTDAGVGAEFASAFADGEVA